MASPRSIRRRLLAAALSALAGALAMLAGRGVPGPTRVAVAGTVDEDRGSFEHRFARPAFLPAPSDNLPTADKVALGRRLFADPLLSANGKIACATCHDPKLAFADGVPVGAGITGRPLSRHTPTLWNLAWSPTQFWDGRAASLEEQARGPIEHPDEMGSRLDEIVERLRPHSAYATLFARAFPERSGPSPESITQALAAYVRTLVSPPTRFDRWIAGDVSALSMAEITGFRLFTGKARCSACHAGFAFTDYAFHDIGLPGDDLGRGPVLGVPAANRSFKTPTLRELAWSAPYMHDGSLATLDEVVRHYELGVIRRPTLSKDLPAALTLSAEERANLVAFLESLSSERPPQPSSEPFMSRLQDAAPRTPVIGVETTTVSQKGKAFLPARVRVLAGSTLTIINDDTRTHNIRIYDPRLDVNTGAQEPGEVATVVFTTPGTFEAICGIHPTMRLTIEVAPVAARK